MSRDRDINKFPSKEHWQQRKESPHLRIIEWLLKAKAETGLRHPHIWVILGLTALLTYIYYAVLTAFHDVYVLLFFYPLIYAAIVYRLRGIMVGGLVFLGILLPYAVSISYDPYLLVRLLIFALFTFIIGSLGASLFDYLERQLDAYKEISSLNEELNSYIKRLESTQKQLVQSEKLNAIGQLAAAVAHELNNPLSGVLTYSKLLAKKVSHDSFDKEEALSDLSKMESAVSHCTRIVRCLIDFARQSEPVLQPVAMKGVIDQVMYLVSHKAELKGVKVVTEDISPEPPVMADFGQLQQVFVNLVVNAIEATPEGGRITIRSSLDDSGWVRVSVQDTGCGISRDNMEKLFTPFFTTKGLEKGVGLGLAVSYGIIERHGGRIEVQSEVGKGSTFSVYLPVCKQEMQPASPH